MTDHRTQLQNLLRELFQFDSADLDFGIYRIMNQRRAEIETFVQKGLLDTVAQELGLLQADAAQTNRGALEKKAKEVRAAYTDAAIGADGNIIAQYAQLPLALQYAQLKAEVEHASVSAETEAEIFNALYTFFSRYYDAGDFVTKRRYSRHEKYAVPYNGEEVLLHWANRDQYYVKTADTLTDYSFVIATHGGYRVRFKIASADTEQNNVKGENRFFVPVARKGSEYDEAKRELAFYFEYRPLTDKEKETFGKSGVQAKIVEVNHERLLNAVSDTTLRGLLAAMQLDQDVSLLARHLTRWTRKSTSDYFIHKDLSSFLNRELDFYIKNEVMRLDDIDEAEAPRVESYLTRVKVIKRIARRIIEFLAQIEEFQKRLFEKPKFVLESNWCVTLDRVPKELLPKIAGNDAQWKEWERLFSVEKPKGGEKKVSAFLIEHAFLTIDTALYDTSFKDALLAALSARDAGLTAQMDGLLIHSENLQALNLLVMASREQVKSIYIDPPYNMGGDDFIYKDSFQHSTWLAMMEDRLRFAYQLLSKDGVIFVSIDENEYARLRMLLTHVFGPQFIENIIWRKKSGGGQTDDYFVTEHDYVLCYAKEKGTFKIKEKTIEKSKDGYPGFDKKKRKHYASVKLAKWGSGAHKEDRRTMHFPLKDPDGKDNYPVAPDGRPGRWRYGKAAAMDLVDNDGIEWVKKDGVWIPYEKVYEPEEGELSVLKERSILYDLVENTAGSNELKALFGFKDAFQNPKPSDLVHHLMMLSTHEEDSILDFFAGSGTTAHAVINVNRDEETDRKYILVEQGGYFDTILMPRIRKVVYAADWRDGKPIDGSKGSGHAFQYLRLESYEDTLDNLDLQRDAAPALGLFVPEHDDYLLKYFLDHETRALQLNVAAFATPFDYQIRVRRDGTEKRVKVDLVETANHLLGLTVNARRAFEHQERTYRVVEGAQVKDSVIVIWRDTNGLDLKKEAHDLPGLVKLTAADRIYVNGESHIPNTQPIEAVFLNAMRGVGS